MANPTRHGMTPNAQAFDDWIRGRFAKLNTELERLQESLAKQVLPGGASAARARRLKSGIERILQQ